MELQEQDIDIDAAALAPTEGAREEEVGHHSHMASGKTEEEDDDSSEDWVRDQHELDCPLCRALLFDPITTSCGHNFCRSCIVRALDYNNRCPVCRTVVFLAPNHAVNSVIKNLAANTFPKEYRRRIAQARKEAQELCHNLPLFVLNVVLFPGMSLDLHVFEPRYRNLIAHSLASSRCFGIVNGSAKVGCVVDVNSYLRIPDGRSLLLVKGTSRFSIHKRWESAEHGYEIAEVEILNDEAETSATEADQSVEPSANQVASALRELVQQKLPSSAMQTFQQQLGPLPPASDPQALSFWVAAYLPVSLAEHQELLEMTSVRERLVKEKDLLTNLTARSIQQRRAPTVARPMNAKRGLTMHVLLLIFFIILLIWTRVIEDSMHAEEDGLHALPMASE